MCYFKWYLGNMPMIGMEWIMKNNISDVHQNSAVGGEKWRPSVSPMFCPTRKVLSMSLMLMDFIFLVV